MTNPNRLQERSQVLGVLAAKWIDATNGAGSAVAVTGAAGMGKTAVVKAFRDSVGAANVLVGGCDDLHVRRPLGPFRDAGLLGDFDEIVADLRQSGPTLLVIEDVHWADEATLDLLAFLVRRIEDAPVLVVVTTRGTGLGGLPVRRVSVDGLSVNAVAELAAGSNWDAGALHDLTGGNPFFVTEMLEVEPDSALPATVVDAVRASIQGLDCVDALERLSVLTSVVEFDVAERLLGGSLDVVAPAEEAGILDVRDGGLVYRYDIVRRAIEANLSGLRRRALHRDVVDALARYPHRDLPRLVRHAIAVNDADTLRRYAAAAARQSDGPQAVELFEVALLNGDDVLDEYAQALSADQRFAEAVDTAHKAVLHHIEAGDPVAITESEIRLSRHYYKHGYTADALSVARDAAVHGDAASLANLGALLALVGDLSAATVLGHALELAHQANRSDLIAQCLIHNGEVRAGLDLARRHGHREQIADGQLRLAELLYAESDLDGLEGLLVAGSASQAVELDGYRAQLRIRRGDLSDATQLRVRARLGHDVADELVGVFEAAVGRGVRAAMALAGAALAEYAWLADRVDLAELVREHSGPEVAWGEALRYCARAGVDVTTEVQPWAAGICGDWRTAATEWERIGDPYERALELAESGDEQLSRRALLALDELGAVAAAAVLRRKLRGAGVRSIPRGPRRATRLHPAGLTSRQADVLELVAEGYTNAEIAKRLFLSVRTVDHHVSSILGKLGVGTRREAAEFAMTFAA